METFLTILHIFVGLVLILVVLLQTGKGSAMGSAFGGSSQTVFGTSGAGNFLSKFTTVSAIIFMLTSLTLSAMTSKKEKASLLTSTDTSIPAQTSSAPLPAVPATEKTGETGTAEPAKSAEVGVVPPPAAPSAGGESPANAGTPVDPKTN